MWTVTLRQPWLVVEFDRPMDCLGWTPQAGGACRTSAVLWREVRDDDLGLDLDPVVWLAGQTAGIGHADSPCFLTSRRIATWQQASCSVDGITARAIATAGLGNVERIGQRRGVGAGIGTINLLLAVDRPLTLGAQIEAISLMAEARTLAMIEHAPRLWQPQPTGTGTDCLCLAQPCDSGLAAPHAGKHTALGEAIGRAALDAFGAAIAGWSPHG